ncbi:MAG TPA: ATP-binding protein [Thermoanaerobaculia bacterium]|nr:ATP-binding protein [Thermoanaerobaculia bacterium]
MRQTADRELELTLPMLPDIEIAAARAAGNLARQTGMSAEKIDEMAHAIIEACINAREHACCADQRIYLRFVAGTGDGGRPKIEVWIRDHGKGFDPRAARDRRKHLQTGPRRRGWGLQIMEAHMDEVDIESGSEGTTIHMVKYGE